MNDKKMCGLWHIHVQQSVYNKNGECRCIGCVGNHCHGCKHYAALAALACMTNVMDKTHCQLCQAYNQNQR